MTSKIHLACDGRGLPLAFTVTAGNINDCTRLIEVVEAIAIRRAGPGRPRTRPGHLIADKGYSTRIIRDYLRRRRIPHTIPERSDQVAARARRGHRRCGFDRDRYRRRNVVERCFNQLKRFRGLATRYEKLAAGRRVDGVFINDIEVDDPRIPLLQKLELPAVAIKPGAPFPFPAVRQEPESGIAAVIEHLVELGHRNIAYVGGRPDMWHSVQRERAWRAALDDRGLRPGPVVPGDFTYLGGASAASSLLELTDPPTAVVCANDLSAIGLIAQAQHLGVDVPGELSVAGFDDIRLGTYVRPRLTTVHTNPRELGREAGKMLLDLIDDGTVEDVRVPDAALVVRGSTSRVRAAG